MALQFRRIARTVLAIAALLVLLCGQALAASIPCYINSNTKIYQHASSSARSMNVPRNMSVTMTAYRGGWARVTRSGNTAYIPLKYLTLKNRLTGYTTRSTKIYRYASTSSRSATLSRGTAVYIIGRDGNFFRVQNSSGSVTGYVPVSYVSPSKPSDSSSSSGSSGSSSSGSYTQVDKLMDIAEKYLGYPYATHADPPSSFDCSGYVKYCFAKIGVSVPGTAKDQGYSGYTKVSSIGSLQQGDIVCFNTNASDGDLSDHTGIYIGGGYFVHASSSAGKVIVSTLSSGYYKTNFSWGRRVL